MNLIVNLVEIIKVIPDFLLLFIPGFIFLMIFLWLCETKIETSAIIVWSILISVLIKSAYSLIHSMVLSSWDTPETLKMLVLSATGAILGVLCFQIKRSNFFKDHLYSLFRKTPNSDIFLDLFDYEKPVMLEVHLHNSTKYYIGQLCINNKEWISLFDYGIVNESDDSTICDKAGKKVSIMIKVEDISSIEVYYEDDSKVWYNIHPHQL